MTEKAYRPDVIDQGTRRVVTMQPETIEDVDKIPDAIFNVVLADYGNAQTWYVPSDDPNGGITFMTRDELVERGASPDDLDAMIAALGIDENGVS